MQKTYLVTGAAGFIGYFLATQLLKEGNIVIGVDNLNDYYDPKLKEYRLSFLKEFKDFNFYKSDISKKSELEEVFKISNFDYVIHLAAQAGVRYSINNPDAYIESNIVGTHNILEMCRYYPVKHLVYASSSSVYGANKKVPFEETDSVDNPVSLYAATKKSNELMAYTYSHLYNIPITGLRFFTVYGPLGRPDMAYFSFTDKYFNGEVINVYNNADFDNDMYRDFTYVDDVVEGIIKVLKKPPPYDKTRHRVLNLGNSKPEKLMTFIKTLEVCLTESLSKPVTFKIVFEPIKPGDVHKTYASVNKLEELINFKPKTQLKDGLKQFTDWYVRYYKK